MPNKRKSAQKRLERREKEEEKKDSLLEEEGPTQKNRECGCEAIQHDLINNCLRCGRIVCSFEGSGPCLTCNALVCTNAEEEIINEGSKASIKLTSKLLGNVCLKDVGKLLQKESSEEFEKAIEHKEMLLEFDRAVERRTKVIDDEGDFFDANTNKWLSNEQRKKLAALEKEQHEARHSRKTSYKATLDFEGKQIVEETNDLHIDVNKILNEDVSIYKFSDMTSSNEIENYKPKYCKGISVLRRVEEPVSMERKSLRLQHPELQSLADEGMCLSIQQPYASLIIAGIKKHEGRSWSTQHRGLLWIHAGAKRQSSQEMGEIQKLYESQGVSNYPKNFDFGCLLGCVTLSDCLSQEQYREKFPYGDSGAPYVFLLDSPEKLDFNLPMSGQREIFKLKKEIHNAVKKLVRI